MKLLKMMLLDDEDYGDQFHSVVYQADDFKEFCEWCEANCKGKWGTETSPAWATFATHTPPYFGWLYDDRDAMLFKLSFS